MDYGNLVDDACNIMQVLVDKYKSTITSNMRQEYYKQYKENYFNFKIITCVINYAEQKIINQLIKIA